MINEINGSDHWTMMINSLMVIVQGFVYFFLIFRLFKQTRTRIQNKYSEIELNKIENWIKDIYECMLEKEKNRIENLVPNEKNRQNSELNVIEEIYCLSGVSSEPNCLFITGHSGVGKTCLIEHYLQNHPREELADRTSVPVFSVEIPFVEDGNTFL